MDLVDAWTHATSQCPLVDVIEDDPSDVNWHSSDETNRILSMMTDLHRDRIDALSSETARLGTKAVGGLYKRTRDGIQRAEARFDGIAGCLRTPNGGSSRQSIVHIENGQVRTRLLSKREAARLMGLPDTYKLPEKYNDAYHLAGDGVAVPVVAALASAIFEPILRADRVAKLAAE